MLKSQSTRTEGSRTEGSLVKRKPLSSGSEMSNTRFPSTPVLSQRTERNVGKTSVTPTPSLLVYEHKQEDQIATVTEGEIRGGDTSLKGGFSAMGPWGDMMITPATINRKTN